MIPTEEHRFSSVVRACFLAAMVLFLWQPDTAEACATCFGAADSPMTQGMNNAILFLLGIVGVVQVGFIKLFWDMRKRSKMLAERKEQFRIVEGGL